MILDSLFILLNLVHAQQWASEDNIIIIIYDTDSYIRLFNSLSAHQYLSRAGAHSAAAHLRLLESKHVLQFFVCKRSPESQGDNLFITHLFEGQC